MDVSDIALVVRKKRDALGLTQQDLAFRSGVHLRSINNLEGGKGNPSIDILLKVAEVLKLELIVRSQ